MKLVFVVILLPMLSFSQDVKVNVYDKFIKQWRIELEAMPVVQRSDAKVFLAYTSIASGLYLEISGSGWGASTIAAKDKAIFLFSNDSSIVVESTALQTFEPGKDQNTYKHQYVISQTALEALSKYDLIGIRKYSFKDFSDISIPRQNIDKVKKLSNLFIKELKKSGLIKNSGA